MSKNSIAYQRTLEHLEQYKKLRDQSAPEESNFFIIFLSLHKIGQLWKNDIYYKISIVFYFIYFSIIVVVGLLIFFNLIRNLVTKCINMKFSKKTKMAVSNCSIDQETSSVCEDVEKNFSYVKMEDEKNILKKEENNLIVRRSSGSIKLKQKCSLNSQNISQENDNKKTL